MEDKTREGPLIRVFFKAAGFLVLSFVISYWVASHAEKCQRKVMSRISAIAQLDHVLFHLEDAGARQRGYLITGNDSYLASYQAAVSDLQTEQRTLDAIASAGEFETDRVASLKDLISRRVNELDRTVELRRYGGVQQAPSGFQEGAREMDQIVSKIAAMRGKKKSELDQAVDTATRVAKIPGIMLPIAVGLNLFVLYWAYIRTTAAITELNRAEDRLRRQAALIDLAPDAIFVRAVDGAIKFWSRGAETLYGWTREEAVDKNAAELLKTESPTPIEAIIKQVQCEGNWKGELTHATKDGPKVTVQSFWTANRTDSGWELLESNVDITERKRAQESLQLSEEKFRVVFEQAAVGIGRLNVRNGHWIDVNQALCRLLGYAPEELLAIDLRQITHPDDVKLDFVSFEAMEAGKLTSYTVDKRLMHRQGRTVWARLTLSLAHDVRGFPDHAIVIIEDITKRRRLEEDLRIALQSANRAIASAEQAGQAKDQFLAVLSHELRTPLTPVLAAVSLMKSEGNLPAHASDRLGIIQRNVSAEARLIDDLLDLTRIARGKVSLQKAEVDVCEILDQVAETCKPDIEAKRLHFGIEKIGIEKNRPLPVVFADPSRLQQIFRNLLNNSIKFTAEGGCVGIRAFGDEKNSTVVVEIIDTGIGIEESLMPRIFDAFEQGGQGITRQFGGLGLGLAITKRLVQIHGGMISAESEGKNRGSKFRVVLPITKKEAEKELGGQVRSDDKSGNGFPREDSRRILLVEDHTDTAVMMKELLQLSGYEVETAADVAQSLEAIDHRDFDLVISDLGLPDRSGLELMQELHERKKSLKGIALSGYGREEDIQRSKEVGFSDHLTKPVDPDTLLAAVRRAV